MYIYGSYRKIKQGYRFLDHSVVCVALTVMESTKGPQNGHHVFHSLA